MTESQHPRRWRILAVCLICVIAGALAAGFIVWNENRQALDAERERQRAIQAARNCAAANRILASIDANRGITQELLRLLAGDRREAAAAALNDGSLDDAARRSAAARQFDQLADRLRPVDRFDC